MTKVRRALAGSLVIAAMLIASRVSADDIDIGVTSGSYAGVGSYAETYVTQGYAIQGTYTSAWNQSGAYVGTDAYGLGTGAYSEGESVVESYGYLEGDALGSTGGFANQYGFAGAFYGSEAE